MEANYIIGLTILFSSNFTVMLYFIENGKRRLAFISAIVTVLCCGGIGHLFSVHERKGVINSIGNGTHYIHPYRVNLDHLGDTISIQYSLRPISDLEDLK